MRTRTKIIPLMILVIFAVESLAETGGLYRPTLAFQPFLDKTEVAEDYVPPPPGTAGGVDVKTPMPWLSAGIPEMLYFMLGRTYTVNLVSSSAIRTAMKKRGFELGPDTPNNVITEAARLESADYIVSGEFDKTEDTINIFVIVYDLAGVATGSTNVSGKIEEVFAVEEEAAKAVLNIIGIRFDNRIMLQDPTSSLEAYKWFSEGSAKYYTGERIANFDRALSIDPDFVELHMKIAEANRLEGAYEATKASYENARGLADVYPEAPTFIGYSVAKLNPAATDEPLVYYAEALAMDPAYAPAVELIGSQYFKKEDYKTAGRYFDQLVEVQPGNAMGYYLKGNVLWMTGSKSADWQAIYRDAIRQYDKALGVNPDFAEAYYNRGSIYKAFEDKTNAAADYIQYLRLKPESPYKNDIIETLKLWEVPIPPGLEAEIKIGDTKDTVLKALGEPLDINTTITEYGTHEQWVYDYDYYVYFDNGRVSSIQY